MKVILRHRRLIFIIHIFVALAFLPGLWRLENDNSPEVFFARDARALENYYYFCREFGGGQAVRLALNGEGIWTKNGLTWLSELEKRASDLDGVEIVIGLAAQYRWLFLEWPPPNPDSFRRQVIKESSEIGSGWISSDGNTVTLVVFFSSSSPAKQRLLLSHLEQLATQAPQGIEAHLSGLPVFHLTMDRSLAIMASRFLPLLVLLAALFLLFIFRRLGDVVIPLFFVAVFQTILFGIMGYAGVYINLVNIILAPLLFVISMAMAVHILLHFRNLVQQGIDIQTAVSTTYQSKLKPVLWTGLTTLVAFGSLMTGSVPAVRTVGLWSAVGIILMTIMVITFYPLLLVSFGINSGNKVPKLPRPFEIWARKNGKNWARCAIRLRIPILIGALVLMVLALWGLTRIHVDDNIGKYFSRHHPVRQELERLQQQGIGVFAAELIISKYNNRSLTDTSDEEEDGFHNPADQLHLAQLSAQLRSNPLIYGAIGSGDLVEAALRSLWVEGKVNENTRWMALGMVQSVPESRSLYQTMVSKDGKSARITLLVPMLSFNRMAPLFEEVKRIASRYFPGDEVQITGQYPLILLAQQNLLRGLVMSLSLTFFCIALVFGILLRNIRLTLLVLVPNLWPVLLVMGGMGWLAIPLDSASVMTVSIVLGLAVDDTFHTLGHFRRLAPRYGARKAIEDTLERTAPAHILTSIILIAGFAACFFSDLLPVSRMGALSALAIFLALIGDLLLIPALLTKVPTKKLPI